MKFLIILFALYVILTGGGRIYAPKGVVKIDAEHGVLIIPDYSNNARMIPLMMVLEIVDE